MAIEGLIISDPSKEIKEIRISPTSIWLHFIEPKNFNSVIQESNELITKILAILKPKIYKRMGWRTYFARENLASNPFEKLKMSRGLNDFDLQDIVLTKQFKDIQARIELSSMTKHSDSTKRALLFDIDLGFEIKDLATASNLGTLRDVYRSDELLDSLEELLENG